MIIETMTAKTAWKLRQKSSMVFQNYNLFQHRTVLENITDPLNYAKKMNKEDAKRKAVELLQMVGLEEKAGQYPRSCQVDSSRESESQEPWQWSPK